MALNIKDDEADRVVRELARETGETITTAITVAARERLERLRGAAPQEARRARLAEVVARAAALPRLDDRPADDILGYDARGLPS